MSNKPTVGRIVHFYTTDPAKQFNGQGSGPYVAIVTQSPLDGPYINLKVVPPFGPSRDEGSVSSKEDAEGASADGIATRWWEWPPRGE